MIAAAFWWMLRLFALGALLCLLLRELTGDRFQPVRLFTYFTPWVLLALLAALIVATAGRRGGTAVLLAMPATALALAYFPLFLPRSAPAPPADQAFKVMSFNVWSQNAHLPHVAALIRRERPDLLLLQEVVPERYPELLKGLEGLYPEGDLHAAYAPKLLQAVVSRFPLGDCVAHRAKGQAQKIVVRMPWGDLTVFNVHLLRRGDWTHRHTRLARLLAEEILPVQGAVIVAGDFNTTEGSEIYGILSRHLRNAHREGGRGFGFTFPAGGVRRLGPFPLPPLVRIDHVFYNGELALRRTETLSHSVGSDHRPIIAEFVPATPGRRVSPILSWSSGSRLICSEPSK